MEAFVINLATLYANMVNGVVAPSHSISSLIKSRGVCVPITEIPTGVDIDFFSNANGQSFRQTFDIPADALVIGHLGRLAPEKNIDFLVTSAIAFLKHYQNAVFLVVGEGPGKEKISKHFQKAKMEDRIIIAGQQTGPALADAYGAMDLFLFTSFSETQGMVLAEAMAAGVPVIALDASGVRDIVVDNENGRLLPESSTQDNFANAIYTAVNEPNLLQKWQKGAQQTAKEHSRGVCAHKLFEFYRSCLNSYNPSEKTIEKGEFKTLDALVERIKVEWDLLSTKVKSAVESSKA
jgi:glycosyltransferase involved in cell wall biosynthesis